MATSSRCLPRRSGTAPYLRDTVSARLAASSMVTGNSAGSNRRIPACRETRSTIMDSLTTPSRMRNWPSFKPDRFWAAT